jgi:hypothetical protein
MYVVPHYFWVSDFYQMYTYIFTYSSGKYIYNTFSPKSETLYLINPYPANVENMVSSE